MKWLPKTCEDWGFALLIFSILLWLTNALLRELFGIVWLWKF
jgi:hypothetical protein